MPDRQHRQDRDDNAAFSRAFHQREEEFRLLVSAVRDYAIFMLDPQGRVSTWNAGAEAINGYRAEEIIGQSFAHFYTPEDVRAGVPTLALATARRAGRFVDQGLRVRKDGSRIWAEVVITPLRDEHGELRGYAKVTRDITAQRRRDEALRALAAALETRARETGADERLLELAEDLRALIERRP
jgi:PAS domain S-box-containing protein